MRHHRTYDIILVVALLSTVISITQALEHHPAQAIFGFFLADILIFASWYFDRRGE